MTKIHTQLQLPIPSLLTITEKMVETANCYAQKTITLDQTNKYKLPSGDMAAVDYRLYAIIINHFKTTTELFAGAINHHPKIQTWYTARKQDTFWGGLYDSMQEHTWANLRALINPPFEANLVQSILQKIYVSLLNSTEALFVLTLPSNLILGNKTLQKIKKIAMTKTIIKIPKKEYNFIHIKSQYNDLKGQPYSTGSTQDIHIILIHKTNTKTAQTCGWDQQIQTELHTYAKNFCPKAE